jgi:CRP-like cAMP-binding protein
LTNRLLEAAPAAVRETLLAHATVVRIERGQVDVVPGMPLGHVDFPISALHSSIVHYADGNTREVAIVGNNGFLPIEPVVGERRARRTVFCQIRGEVVRVPLEAFEHALREVRFGELVQRFLGARLFAAEQLVACNLTHGLLQRCARWLLNARDGVGSDVFAITHESLALTLGVRRSGVTEAIAVLQAADAVRPRRGEVRILDAGRLETFSCECYAAVSEEFERVLGRRRRGDTFPED